MSLAEDWTHLSKTTQINVGGAMLRLLAAPAHTEAPPLHLSPQCKCLVAPGESHQHITYATRRVHLLKSNSPNITNSYPNPKKQKWWQILGFSSILIKAKPTNPSAGAFLLEIRSCSPPISLDYPTSIHEMASTSLKPPNPTPRALRIVVKASIPMPR